MNLTDEEKEAIKMLIDRFSELFERLKKSEEKLDLLDKTRSLLTEQIQKLEEDINETRRIESDITSELIEKYGEFEIDLETFDIIPKYE